MKGHITIYLLIEAGSVIQAGSQKCLESIAEHLEWNLWITTFSRAAGSNSRSLNGKAMVIIPCPHTSVAL